MKYFFKLILYTLLILSIFSASCKKHYVPTVTTSELTNVTNSSVTCGGIVTDEGSAFVSVRGICWGTNSDPTIADNRTDAGVGPGTFSSDINGLEGATDYYFRAYATNSFGTGYGTTIALGTDGGAPSAITQSASDIAAFSATLNGSIIANLVSTTGYFEYGPNVDYGNTVSIKQSTAHGYEETKITADIQGLTPEKTYHFRSKAVNHAGTAYGKDMIFNTTNQLPITRTSFSSEITDLSATLNGIVNPNGLSTGVTFDYWANDNIVTSVSVIASPVDGTSFLQVSAKILNLIPGSNYSFRLKATNIIGTATGTVQGFKTMRPGWISDRDGNAYNIVTIGSQVWMAENLRTTTYLNGIAIPNIAGWQDWGALSSEAYCWFNNDIGYKNDYGALYNWYTIKNGNLCPTGWHVPTDAEWTVLVNYCGGESVAGDKLKGDTPTAIWLPAQNYWGMTNETGFTASPGAARNPEGPFWLNMGYMGNWWSSSESDYSNAFSRSMFNKPGNVRSNIWNKKYGLSVRCIRD